MDGVAEGMPEDYEIRRQTLWDAMCKAQAEYTKAAAIFDGIVSEVPSGIPAPDGALRIELVGKARRAAFTKYEKALSEFSAFILKSKQP
jgi:hypothetical protein